MSFFLVQGDLAPNLGITVDITGLVEPLSVSTAIKMHWIKPDKTESLVTLTPVNLATGVLQYVWQAGDTAIPGVHKARVVVTLSSGKTQSYPSDPTWIYWYVSPYTV